MSQNSILFRLPAELRVIIYEFAIVQEESIDIETAGARPPSIAQSCQIIRQETLPIFYQKNRFSTWIVNYDLSVQTQWLQLFQPLHHLPSFKGVNLLFQPVHISDRGDARRNLSEIARRIIEGAEEFTIDLEQCCKEAAPLRDDDHMGRLVHFFAIVSKLHRLGHTWEDVESIVQTTIDGMMLCGEL